jgi:hypothetical protein
MQNLSDDFSSFFHTITIVSNIPEAQVYFGIMPLQ